MPKELRIYKLTARTVPIFIRGLLIRYLAFALQRGAEFRGQSRVRPTSARGKMKMVMETRGEPRLLARAAFVILGALHIKILIG